jgi:hypothetical protein
MITDYLASLVAGAGPRFVGRAEIFHSQHLPPLPYDITYTFPHGRTERRAGTAMPDEVFGIRYGETVRYFALENENASPALRNRLTSSSFLRKALAYQDIIRSGRYKEQLGVGNLRIIVTASTSDRLANRMKVVADHIGRSNVFLFVVVPRDGKLPNMFTTPYLRVGFPPLSLDTNSEVVE